MENTISTKIQVLIFLGPPGAGKGSLASLLSRANSFPHISTGDLLREHVAEKTSLGIQAEGFMEKGKLVPDALMFDMFFARFLEEDCKRGCILDGFPRTLPQAIALDQKGLNIKVIHFDISDEALVQRITGRLICKDCSHPYHVKHYPPKEKGHCDYCGSPLYQRPDDQREVITKRLETYRKETHPLIEHYKDKKILFSLNCEKKSKDALLKEIILLLK